MGAPCAGRASAATEVAAPAAAARRAAPSAMARSGARDEGCPRVLAVAWCCGRGWHARGLPDGAIEVRLAAACWPAVEGGCVEATC